MYIVRTTGPLHEPKHFNFKLRLMRHTDHKNGTPSVAKRPRLVINKNFQKRHPENRTSLVNQSSTITVTPHLTVRLGGLSVKAGCYAFVVLAYNVTFSYICCKPHSHSSHTVRKPTTMKLWSSTTVAQHGPHNLEVVGLNPTRVSVFSHVCAHFDMMQYNATCYSATSECRQVNRNTRIGN